MLDRQHLTLLRTLANCGSLTQTATRLHLTQPALTHTIKKLEARLGIKLWEKQGRRIRLTEAGEWLAALAERLLPQFEYAEAQLLQMAQGKRGILRIGMECHPCYQWLLRTVAPYLKQWPDVDVDVKQAFKFGGIGALLAYDIDLLITPDPLHNVGIAYTPVFAYEHQLVVAANHPLAKRPWVDARALQQETLLTYPVEPERLDIFSQVFLPAKCRPKHHKTIETTELLLQMVASGRGVAALPDWLIIEQSKSLPLAGVRLNPKGIHKHIYLGTRTKETPNQYLTAFVETAKQTQISVTPP